MLLLLLYSASSPSVLVTCPRRSLCLKLSDTRVDEPQIRARKQVTDDDDAAGAASPPLFGSLAYSGRGQYSLNIVDTLYILYIYIYVIYHIYI